MKLLRKDVKHMDLSHKSDFNVATALAFIGAVVVVKVGVNLSKKVYRRLRPAK